MKKTGNINNIDGIYLHIPFCSRKCEYCDFCTYVNMEKHYKKYTDYLIKEIRMYPKYIYDTIYFGGGTPSLLPIPLLNRIMNELSYTEKSEITLELNPNDMKKEKLKDLRKIGINRLSIGIQSFNDDVLKFIGRDHSGEDAIRVFEDAREVGFDNITIDLMFGIPIQTIEDVKKDLNIIKRIQPDNVSIYSLIWEEGTIFWSKLQKGILKEIDQDVEAEMYEMIIDFFNENGFNHYEISNFSRNGKKGRHNLKYWECKEFIGVGMSAASYYSNKRYSNVRTFNKYYNLIDSCKIPEDEKTIELVDEYEKRKLKNMLGLRLVEKGIDFSSIDEHYKKSAIKLLDRGLLNKKGNRLTLTRKGLLLANDVFVEFI